MNEISVTCEQGLKEESVCLRRDAVELCSLWNSQVEHVVITNHLSRAKREAEGSLSVVESRRCSRVVVSGCGLGHNGRRMVRRCESLQRRAFSRP